MGTMDSRSPDPDTARVRSGRRWRTLDIVVTAVIAVAFGVVFWAWDGVWSVSGKLFTFAPATQAVLYGVWLLPAVLGGLVIRKPGAAFFCELVAAMVAALLGNQWGATTIPQGAIEGLAGELAFLLVAYRSFRLPVALLAGAFAGLGATLFDAVYWYRGYAVDTYRLPYVLLGTASAVLLAGAGGWALTGALARTGVLDRFPSGRQRVLV